MATFNPNPNFNTEPWIERPAMDGSIFRIWHLMFFCFAGCLTVVTLICCCVRIRVPRTKQEIEADYQRKKITSKFKERLQQFENQDMDAIDLKKALEIMQEDFKRMDVSKAHDQQDYFKNIELQPHSTTRGLNKLVALMKIKVKTDTNRNPEGAATS